MSLSYSLTEFDWLMDGWMDWDNDYILFLGYLPHPPGQEHAWNMQYAICISIPDPLKLK